MVAADEHLMYDSLVRPGNYRIDYNTKFSGITACDLIEHATKLLRDVQKDVMGFINANTVLVGDGLKTDLRVLLIIHGIVVDKSVIFLHSNGVPYLRSLKSLLS